MLVAQENGVYIFDRAAAIEFLIERDGNKCMYPGCELGFDEDSNGRHSVSIDHIYPQVRAKADGWTYEQIWDISNLQLMGRNCNAKKSDLLYDEDGNLPVSERTKSVKMARPENCDFCANGRLLFPGEQCPECESGPQPTRWPATLQKTPKECDHSTYHCWFCVVEAPDLRIPAIQRIAFG